MNRRKMGHLVVTFAFPTVITAIIVLVVASWRDLAPVFASSDGFRHWVHGFGTFGPAVFVGVQAFQVIVFVIPGEVAQIASGYLFGVFLGVTYSVLGIAAGSAFNFFLARILGIQFVEGLFKKEQVDRFETLISSGKARAGFFLLFLIPGIPKDILCYVAGISRMGFWSFLIISMVGRMPGIVASAIIGSSAARSNWVVTAVVTGAAVLLFLIGLIFRAPIQRVADRIGAREAIRGAGQGGSAQADQQQTTAESAKFDETDGALPNESSHREPDDRQ